MLKSLRNHKTGSGSLRCLPLLSQPTRSLNAGLLVRADAEKKKIKSLMMIKKIAIEFLQSRQIGLKVNTILET